MNKIIQVDYTTFQTKEQLKLPIEVEYLIPKDDSVRLLSLIVEEMNLEDLYQTYSLIKENSITPEQLLKIVLYANMNHIYSSRQIELACKRDINFMYLLNGKAAPDHSTIARFRSLHFAPVCESIMAQFTNFLGTKNEISTEYLFIDGTKIEAAANKYTFVWKKTVTKNMQRMFCKIETFVLECEDLFGIKVVHTNEIQMHHLKKLFKKLNQLAVEEKIQFVHGRGTRKSILQRYIEELNQYITRLKKYNNDLQIMKNRNSYSKTDHDATFMRMKDDHMQNGQLKPAYNLQIGVDAGYITWLSCSQEVNDLNTLIPFITTMEKHLNFKYSKIIADSGYESEENYMFLENNGQLSFIKPTNYEQQKTKKFKNDISKKENMIYNETEDYYICKNNKKLYANTISTTITKSGYEKIITNYKCEDCSNCSYKIKCIKGNNYKSPLDERTKQLTKSKLFEQKRAESFQRITSTEGKKLRMNRSIQAEGAFAQIKQNMNFKRFLSRGKQNVLSESIFIAIAHNVNKLHNKIRNNQCKTYLYELKETA